MALFNNLFLSVKWKAVFFTGALLLLFASSFILLNFWNSVEILNTSRNHIQNQLKKDLLIEISNSSKKSQQIAELKLLADNNLSVRKYLLATRQLLNTNRTSLEVDWHLSLAQYLDATGNLLAGWGTELPKNIRHLIPSVILRGKAQSNIDCSQECLQFTLIPIRIRDKVNAIMIVATNLNDTLLNYSKTTGTDIAILGIQQSLSSLKSNYFIPQWNMKINALTSPAKTLFHIQKLAQRYNLFQIKKEQIIRESDSPIRLLAKDVSPIEFQIIHSKQNKDLLFIISDDISSQYQQIIDDFHRNILFSLVGIIAISLGLFFFISKPLSRISSVSKALPLIAQQKNSEAKSLLPEQNSSLAFRDELSQLEKSAIELVANHNNLPISTNDDTSSLSKLNEELQQEHDFVQSLINTAQMLIVTMDKDCLITSFNHFAETITGYSSDDVINSSFKRFIPNEQWPETKDLLTQLNVSNESVRQMESELVNQSSNSGSTHIISWLFSSLNHTKDESVILAVGLDITEKKRSDEHIIWLAEHDVLTELYNRRKFNTTFEQLLNNAKRFDHKGALLFLDLDQFKDINDRYGHKAGDHVLKQVAKTLLSISRTTDCVARLGGDEFAIILPETDQDGAINFAQKIIERLASMNIRFDHVEYKVTTSIGIAQYPLDGQSIEELMSNADIAMYKAKSAGKNTWYQFDSGIIANKETKKQSEPNTYWEKQIETALEKNRFVLHYQPIMDIQSEAIHHYEVLVRMLDDTNKIHLPASFLPIAERSQLIHSIDHYVIKNSIKLQAELSQVNANVLLSVNLSSAAMNDSILIPLLKRLLKDNNTDPDTLIFELSESSATSNIQHTRDFMELLNSLGYRFSLDDFGKKTSSFHSLQELPVDTVKIDGTYIINLTKNNNDKIFVQAIVDIAKRMGKKTIAEFVQDAETLSLLKTMGVDYAQGYFIGQPKPYFLDDDALLTTIH